MCKQHVYRILRCSKPGSFESLLCYMRNKMLSFLKKKNFTEKTVLSSDKTATLYES